MDHDRIARVIYSVSFEEVKVHRIRCSRRSTPRAAPRIVLAAALLLALVSSTFPVAALASAPMCHLACCAGRAPHAAGSCMNGSCHAFLTGHTKKIHIHHEAPTEQTEQLCGLSRLRVNTIRIPLIETVTIDFGSGSYGDDSHEASRNARDQ